MGIHCESWNSLNFAIWDVLAKTTADTIKIANIFSDHDKFPLYSSYNPLET